MSAMAALATKTKSSTKKRVTKKRSSRPSGGLRSYSTAMRFLETFTDYERMIRVGYNHTTFNLSRMQKILSAVGRPHRKFKSVHIAGTKGKGSCAHMLANMLQACDHKVGLYTSPHLVDMRERIMIDGQMIEESEFLRLLNQLVPVLRSFDEKSRPTFFEIITTIGFMYFAEQKVDIAIIETGLGGRLDSTNVIKPEVCAITSISYDHTYQLGNALSSIAEEKAGIFKSGVPVISVPQHSEVKKVLVKSAKSAKAPIKFTGEDIDFSYRFESSRSSGPHTRICLTAEHGKYEHLPVPLPGEHQAINCGLVLSVIDALKAKGWEIDDHKALEGLAKTRLPGRMEIICDDPRILIDGAHNPASIEALIRTIGQHISYDSMVVIFGCAADKDIDGMLEYVSMGADKVIFTQSNSVRSADPEDLAIKFEERTGRMAQWTRTLREALRIANSVVTTGDIICVTGSFYLAGEAKRIFTER